MDYNDKIIIYLLILNLLIELFPQNQQEVYLQHGMDL